MSASLQDPVPEACLVDSKLMRDQVAAAWSTLIYLTARLENHDDGGSREPQERPGDEH